MRDRETQDRDFDEAVEAMDAGDYEPMLALMIVLEEEAFETVRDEFPESELAELRADTDAIKTTLEVARRYSRKIYEWYNQV